MLLTLILLQIVCVQKQLYLCDIAWIFKFHLQVVKKKKKKKNQNKTLDDRLCDTVAKRLITKVCFLHYRVGLYQFWAPDKKFPGADIVGSQVCFFPWVWGLKSIQVKYVAKLQRHKQHAEAGRKMKFHSTIEEAGMW
jgi:hypothetical protein